MNVSLGGNGGNGEEVVGDVLGVSIASLSST
jgi:hypothetical protein